MPSSICLVNNTAIPTSNQSGINVSAGSTITIKLANTAGVQSWSIFASSADDLTSANGNLVAVNNSKVQSANYTATFTLPTDPDGYGVGLQFTSVVNQGQFNSNSTTFGVWSLTTQGQRVFFGGESNEGNATVGNAQQLNQLVRAVGTGGGGSVTWAADLAGSTSTSQKVVHVTGIGGVIPFEATLIGDSSNSFPLSFGVVAPIMNDADYTLTSGQLTNPFVRMTSSVSLTATRNVILPSNATGSFYYVFNNTTGSQSLTFKASSGTGVAVPNGLKAIIYFDGTNYVPASTVVGGDLSATTNTAQTVVNISGTGTSTDFGTTGAKIPIVAEQVTTFSNSNVPIRSVVVPQALPDGTTWEQLISFTPAANSGACYSFKIVGVDFSGASNTVSGDICTFSVEFIATVNNAGSTITLIAQSGATYSTSSINLSPVNATSFVGGVSGATSPFAGIRARVSSGSIIVEMQGVASKEYRVSASLQHMTRLYGTI